MSSFSIFGQYFAHFWKEYSFISLCIFTLGWNEYGSRIGRHWMSIRNQFPKWRRLDRIWIHNTVCTYPNIKVVVWDFRNLPSATFSNYVHIIYSTTFTETSFLQIILKRRVKCFWKQRGTYLSLKLNVKKETLLCILRMKIYDIGTTIFD